jgi:hypothetical protein
MRFRSPLPEQRLLALWRPGRTVLQRAGLGVRQQWLLLGWTVHSRGPDVSNVDIESNVRDLRGRRMRVREDRTSVLSDDDRRFAMHRSGRCLHDGQRRFAMYAMWNGRRTVLRGGRR